MFRHQIVFLVLALTQITGWGVVGLLPVLASTIAADLATTLPIVFLGTTVMFVVMGLAAPLAGKAFNAFGARRVMAAGAALTGCCLGGLGTVQSVPAYLAVWALTGLAGAMFLTTAAYVYIADIAEGHARKTIGMLMLVTGLAGSVFWPITAFLKGIVGWRSATFIYAVTMLAVVTPMILFALPETGARRDDAKAGASKKPLRHKQVFWLLVAAVTLNGFVTFGMEATGIELFQALGAEPGWAIGIAALLGVFKVCGRLVDLLGGRRWDALMTGLVAAAMIMAGLLPLLILGGGQGPVLACLVLFGIGSGAFAVARATMPLLFYSKADYATAMSSIALPVNLASAMSAPILSGLLTRTGPQATLSLLAICSGAAFLILLCLGRRRRGLVSAEP